MPCLSKACYWTLSALLLAACSSSDDGARVDGGPFDAGAEGLIFADGRVADGQAPDGASDATASDGPLIGTEPLELTRESCARRAQSACSVISRCLGFGGASGWDECVDERVTSCVGRTEALAEGLAEGRLAHDGAAERNCYAERESLPCGEALELSCFDGAIEGKVAEGAACYDLLECLDTHYCVYADACPGSCQPWAAEGEDCPTPRCLVELRCSMEGKCVIPEVKASGDVCDPARPDLFVCEVGTRCRVSDAETYRCLALQAADGPCLSAGDCESGLVCVLPRLMASTDPGTCKTAAAEQESCGKESECAAGLRCVDDGDTATHKLCQPTLAPGGECTGLLESRTCTSSGCHVETPCADGERCFPDPAPAVTSHCGPARTADQPCARNSQCADGLLCYQGAGEEEQHCHPHAAVATFCVPGVCADGLYCNEVQRCEFDNQRTQGQPCPTGGEQCAEGLYCDLGGICQLKLGKDDDCGGKPSDQCADDMSCRFGKCRHNCS